MNLRKPLPPKPEQTFKDKSMYNRPEQRQELKKIIQDVSKELKKSSRTDQIFEQSGIKNHKAPATTKEEEDILEKCRYENVVTAPTTKVVGFHEPHHGTALPHSHGTQQTADPV